jgi:hypothetical protein
VVELYDAHYEMELGCNLDIWRLRGNAINHPDFSNGHSVGPSTPVEFDEATDIMKTASGKTYKIMSYINKASVVDQIKKDILNKGYEVH